MVDFEQKLQVKLSVTSDEKLQLQTLAEQVSQDVGMNVSMTTVIKTLVYLASGDKIPASFPGPLTFNAVEFALLGRLEYCYNGQAATMALKE